MSQLKRFQKIQNKHMFDIVYKEPVEQKFSIFLSEHPNLYAGVPLTSYEIDFLNNHFWDYQVEPETFEQEYIQLLRESVPRYNAMKAIELSNEIYDKVTDRTVRHLAQNRIDTLSRNSNRNSQSQSQSNDSDKRANRELPMKSTGNDFDSTVNWRNGASNIEENKSVASQNITASDTEALLDNSSGNYNDYETIDRTNIPIVELIDKIWDYLLKPKSLEYLTSYIAKAFILVY